METITSRFEYSARIIIYIIVACIPLWFLPLPLGVDAGREITFGILISLAAIFWLFTVLAKGELRYQHSPLLYAGAVVLLVFIVSSFFSKSALISLFYAEPPVEKLTSLIFGMMLMVAVGGIFRSKEDVGNATLLLIFSGVLSALLNLIQLFFNWSFFVMLFQLFGILSSQGADTNVVGTVNGLMVLYAVLLSMSIACITGFWPSAARTSWMYWLLFVSSGLFALNLLAINFLTSWIVLLGASIVLFGITFKNVREEGNTFDWRYWCAFAVLALSVVMIMVRNPLLGQFNLPSEVSPSVKATWGVAKQVFQEGTRVALFGSGPGTFGLDWGKYKDPSINQTPFWSVRFNQGSSWADTMLVTGGILGFLAFIIFLACAFFLFFRALLFAREGEGALLSALLVGFTAVTLSIFLYPENLALFIVFFLSIGFLSLLLGRDRSGFWTGGEQTIRFEAPWAVFLSSLVVIFFVALCVAALYMEVSAARVALLHQQGSQLLLQGKINEANGVLDTAIQIDAKNPRVYQTLLQARMEKIRTIIGRASRGEDVRQEFQSYVSSAVQNAQAATQLFPVEPDLWRMQGALYELIIPFIPGAERFASTSYFEASKLEPLNPLIYAEIGRAGMVYADKLQVLITQSKGSDRDALERARLAMLQDVQRALMQAIDAKGDFAQGHFLLAQTLIRLGNVASAIQSVEKAKVAAPFDTGIAFQLGLLYYQTGDLDHARGEFERAVSINQNFSNARYFLGLIYDRQNNTIQAIDQFEKILVFNPDNQEVQRILANLRRGRDALEGVVPPLESPEKRQEPPIRDNGNRTRRR